MILCCGESLIDMIPDEDGRHYLPHVGGSVLNTAVALGRLGRDVGLLTGLSNDAFGQRIEHFLSESGVSTELSVRSDRKTTLAFVHFKDGHARYSFYDEHSAMRDIGAADLPAIPDTVGAMFFGGISLCNPPVADTLAELLLAQPEDRAVMLDPNLRPGFAEDPTAYAARMERLLARADIIKVSDADLDALFEGPAGIEGKLKRLLDHGPSLVLLTLGGEGARAITRSGADVSVPSVQVTVADTVGAGDTFNAACLAHLDEEGLLARDRLGQIGDTTLRNMLGFAVRAAAVTVSRPGANPPWARELQETV